MSGLSWVRGWNTEGTLDVSLATLPSLATRATGREMEIAQPSRHLCRRAAWNRSILQTRSFRMQCKERCGFGTATATLGCVFHHSKAPRTASCSTMRHCHGEFTVANQNEAGMEQFWAVPWLSHHLLVTVAGRVEWAELNWLSRHIELSVSKNIKLRGNARRSLLQDTACVV